MANQKGNANDFTLVTSFPYGYRNLEDITNLPPGVLVKGSQNVLMTTSKRVSSRRGYTLDGQANSALAPVLRSFDWFTSRGFERNMRAGFLTSAGNDGKLQYRYTASDGTVTWRDLMTSLTSVSFNFTTFWDFNTEKLNFLLFVDGSSNIYEWSGGVTTFASATANTITKQGVETWAETGFYTANTRQITIDGAVYDYTGGEGTTTLTGVTPDPTLGGHAVGSVVHQTVRTTANSAMTSIPSTFKNYIIGNLRNQIYIAASDSLSVYISTVNDYKDFGFTTPVRVVGEGALISLDDVPRAFVPQESEMYISAGTDYWYKTLFTLSSDLQNESFQIEQLKSNKGQGALSQQAVSKIRNNVIVLTCAKSVDTLGRITGVVLTPQATPLSDPIRNDLDNYNLDDAQVFYNNEFAYISVPQEGLIRMYNMIDEANRFWEAPQIMPVSCFSVIAGELYGHSYLTSESYKLFEGYNDNGNTYDCVAAFSYMNFGTRSSKKGMNEFYREGYMTPSTNLTTTIRTEIDGCATDLSYDLMGTSRFVCVPTPDASLGKASLGKNPLGGTLTVSSASDLPPKFRAIRTFPERYFYEMQPIFSSSGIDQRWELLSFGIIVLPITDQNNDIKD